MEIVADDLGESAFEDGHIVPIAGQGAPERSLLVTQYCADFNVGYDEALEIFEWFEENAQVHRGANPDIQKALQAVEASGAEVKRMRGQIFDLAKAILCFDPSQIFFDVRRLFWRLDWLLVDDLLGKEGPAVWARKENISKEMSFRRANEIGDRLNWPRRRDQRSEEAKEKMSLARCSSAAGKR